MLNEVKSHYHGDNNTHLSCDAPSSDDRTIPDTVTLIHSCDIPCGHECKLYRFDHHY